MTGFILFLQDLSPWFWLFVMILVFIIWAFGVVENNANDNWR